MVSREAGLVLLVAGAALTGLGCSGGDITPPPTSGSLAITTSTTGPEPDADGYAVAIDEGTETAIPTSGTLQRDDVEPGSHTIRLTGMAANCTVAGENPRTISISAGETARLDFTITCAALPPTTGTLQVTTTTTGDEPDPDGYTVSVDNGAGQSIGSNASVTIGALAPGSHTVRLTGLAGNCHVVGDNPSSATVVAGAQATVAFGLECPSPALRWQTTALRDGIDLFSVGGSSATDVYALGSLSQGMATFMVHYDGHTWSTVAIMSDNASTQGEPKNFDPSDVWSSSASDVVLVGKDFDTMDAAAVHYDGHAWSAMARLGVADYTAGLSANLFSVWGTSSADVFAVGSVLDIRWHPLAAHYDGTSWSRMTLPGDNYALTDVFGTSSHDVYAVGDTPFATPAVAFVLHYDGGQWAEVQIDYPEGFSPLGVWASAPADVFVVGSMGSTKTGAILHYDGHNWSLMSGPTTAALSDVWGTSGSNVYAVSAGAILHYDGKTWTKVSNRGGGSIWGSSSKDVFVVGNDGLVLHGTP